MYELHVVMKNVNNNMKPKEDEVVSKPWHWPILYKGTVMGIYLDADPACCSAMCCELRVFAALYNFGRHEQGVAAMYQGLVISGSNHTHFGLTAQGSISRHGETRTRRSS